MPALDENGKKRVVSFSVYGSNALYTQGVLENLAEIPLIYPGWTSRVYIDADSPAMENIQRAVDEIVIMDRTTSVPGKWWRHSAVSDPNASYIIIRDADSRVTTRERSAVDAWIASGKNAHLMHEVPAHKDYIMAGMWGLQGGVIPDMDFLIAEWLKANRHRTWSDQNFLRERVWPLIRNDVLCHGCHSDAGPSVPFPEHAPMKFGEYVGQSILPRLPT